VRRIHPHKISLAATNFGTHLLLKSLAKNQNWVGLVLLTAVFMAPAFGNLAPLLMEDSVAYSGANFHWMRSRIPTLLASGLYQLIGIWALPFINSLLNASAWLILRQWLGLKISIWFIAIIAAASLSPLYTSAVLVDSWFFPATVFLIYGMEKNHRLLIAFAAVLFAAHGSSLILVPVLLILYSIIWRRWPQIWNVFLVFVVVFGSNTLIDRLCCSSMPRLSTIFVASKAFSADPNLLTLRAIETGDPDVAYAAKYMQTAAARDELAKGRKDLFWDIWNSDRQRFDIIAFEKKHAGPIVIEAILHRPLLLIRSGIQDFISYYAWPATLDFRAAHETPWPDILARSWQSSGVFESTFLSYLTGSLSLGIVAAAAFFGLVNHHKITVEQKAFVLLAIVMILANDLVFAFLSGPPDRYHHRALPLAGATIIIFIAAQGLSQGKPLMTPTRGEK
jgi:hypothetical protein